MKITILGSGSAYGLPMIFNTWGKANPQNPKNKRSRASILMEEGGKTILVDAGPELRLQINRANVKNIDSVFITHCHYDHVAGVPELPRAAKLLGHGIDVYASSETLEGLKDNYSYLFREKADSEPDTKKINWKTLPDCGKFNVADLEFETILFPHNNIHSSAFRYKNFAYVTDWQEFTPESKEFFKDLELLIIECNNGFEPEENGHSDLYKIKEIQEKYHPKRMILSHLSARIDDDEYSKKIPADCELSYDGMIINI